MSGICGWFGPSDERSRASVISGMTEELARSASEHVDVHADQRFCVGASYLEKRACIYKSDQITAVILGYPVSRPEGRPTSADLPTCARLLVDRYRAQGPDALRLIGNQFSLAIADERNNDFIIAVDRAGIQPLIWTQVQDMIVFGSSCRAIMQHPSVTASVRSQALYDYMYFDVVPGPGTIYDSLYRVEPGSFVRLHQGRLITGRYFEASFLENEHRAFRELKPEFISRLERCVSTFSADPSVGTFLSGGTDSSTVTGFLSRVSQKPAECYSIGFDVEGYDEIEYARIAARHFNAHHHPVYLTAQDVVDAIPLVAAAYDQPFGNSSAIPTYFCARNSKKDGITTLLAGDGGDELFGGNARYAKQYIFSLYQKLPAALRRSLLEPAALSRLGPRVGPFRKVSRYIDQARIPMPDRLETYNLVNWFGPETIFDPDFLSSVDPDGPLNLLRETYDGTKADSMLNKMLSVDMRFTLAYNDLRKVTEMCDLAGTSVCYPLLDDEIVDFSLRLHPKLKLKRTTLRYFFKRALDDFLPAEVISKKKHGFGLPFGYWMVNYAPLQEIVLDTLSDLKKRHVIRPEFIDELALFRIKEHSGYYSNIAWSLMMLELWFRQQPSPGENSF